MNMPTAAEIQARLVKACDAAYDRGHAMRGDAFWGGGRYNPGKWVCSGAIDAKGAVQGVPLSDDTRAYLSGVRKALENKRLEAKLDSDDEESFATGAIGDILTAVAREEEALGKPGQGG